MMRGLRIRGWGFWAALAFAPPVAFAQTAASPAIDPAWLSIDSAARTATFVLIAGHGSANAGLNFNGAKSGALTLTVPKGWTLTVRFVNDDPNLPHSAIVIPEAAAIPVGASTPAFPRALTNRLQEGLQTDAKDEFRFVPDKAGAYWIFCAVPGHGAAGMWIRLTVDAAALKPALTYTGR